MYWQLCEALTPHPTILLALSPFPVSVLLWSCFGFVLKKVKNKSVKRKRNCKCYFRKAELLKENVIAFLSFRVR